mmetsp:Transcript_153408/g.372505  ORF Transcript_153408/g.372505 Transcript_153408/m.372505 type:complete len:298 (-) Transcript_153408:205-1098(-)
MPPLAGLPEAWSGRRRGRGMLPLASLPKVRRRRRGARRLPPVVSLAEAGSGRRWERRTPPLLCLHMALWWQTALWHVLPIWSWVGRIISGFWNVAASFGTPSSSSGGLGRRQRRRCGPRRGRGPRGQWLRQALEGQDAGEPRRLEALPLPSSRTAALERPAWVERFPCPMIVCRLDRCHLLSLWLSKSGNESSRGQVRGVGAVRGRRGLGLLLRARRAAPCVRTGLLHLRSLRTLPCRRRGRLRHLHQRRQRRGRLAGVRVQVEPGHKVAAAEGGASPRCAPFAARAACRRLRRARP